MKINVSAIRPAYYRAKQEFASSWKKNKLGYDESFWEEFGKVNHMKIQVERLQGGFPIITILEFNTEKDYVWFMMRWS